MAYGWPMVFRCFQYRENLWGESDENLESLPSQNFSLCFCNLDTRITVGYSELYRFTKNKGELSRQAKIRGEGKIRSEAVRSFQALLLQKSSAARSPAARHERNLKA
jgi:hypothetical protein